MSPERLEQWRDKFLCSAADIGEPCDNMDCADHREISAHVTALESENRALRQALKEILVGKRQEDNTHALGEYASQAIRYLNIARAALAHPTGDSE